MSNPLLFPQNPKPPINHKLPGNEDMAEKYTPITLEKQQDRNTFYFLAVLVTEKWQRLRRYSSGPFYIEKKVMGNSENVVIICALYLITLAA